MTSHRMHFFGIIILFLESTILEKLKQSILIKYNTISFSKTYFQNKTQNIIFIRSLMCIRINLYHLIVILTKWLTNVEYKILKIDCVKFLQNFN